jgi:hypothetical protein
MASCSKGITPSIMGERLHQFKEGEKVLPENAG